MDENIRFFDSVRIKKHPRSTIKIGRNTLINSSCNFYAGLLIGKSKLQTWSATSKIIIGENCGFNGITIISRSKNIIIGSGTIIAANCVIMDSDMHHVYPIHNRWNAEGEGLNIVDKDVIIEENVWIGLNCIILKGVTIGKGSVIAAGSVVVRDIPPMVVAGGVPAKVIRIIDEQNGKENK